MEEKNKNERFAIWPMGESPNTPEEWRNRKHPNFEPSIYNEPTTIDVTGIGSVSSKGLKQALQGLKRVQIGETLHVFEDTTSVIRKIMKRVDKGLKKGENIQWGDGRRQFMQEKVVKKPGGSGGSSDFFWDKSGNKVKHSRQIITEFPNGGIVKQDLRPVYKKF